MQPTLLRPANDRLQIEYGTRFYGYREENGECSYASVDVDNAQEALSSLTFTFKTEEESGVLLYSGNDVSNLLQKKNALNSLH